MGYKFNPFTSTFDIVGAGGGGGGGVTAVTASAPLTSSGGTTPDIAIPQATGSADGFLDSADWTTFNNKQPAGNYITALTGDVTATGPGSVAATLATVNGAPGSFGSASDTLTATVNGKGLITALAATAIAIAQSQVTGLVADLALKAPLASPTFTGSVEYGNYVMNPSLFDAGNSGTTLDVDLSAGSYQTITLTGNVTLTLSNPQTGGVYTLEFIQGAGPFTVTWPASLRWPGGFAPVISTANGAIDLVNLVYNGTAATYRGTFAQSFA